MKPIEVFKKVVVWALIIGGLSIAGIYVYLHFSPTPPVGPARPPEPQTESGASFLSDNRPISDYRTFVGGATNIFVGKVLAQTGTEVRDGGFSPRAIFDVEAIYNVKGSLRGIIRVSQFTAPHFDNPTMDRNAADYIIRPWHTYLLVVIYGGDNDPYFYLTLSSNSQQFISDNPNFTNTQLEELARKDGKVYELLNAYPNEILNDYDIQHGNTLNSFQSLSDQEKQAVYAKFQELIPSRPVPDILQPPPPPPPPRAESRPVYPENNYALCHDNIDNDGNGLIDSVDPACVRFYPKPTPSQPSPPPSTPTSTLDVPATTTPFTISISTATTSSTTNNASSTITTSSTNQ